MSCMSPDELRFAIMSGDASFAFASAPGIGKKTAEKLIVELRDKVDIEKMLDHAAHPEETIQTDMAKTSANEMQSEAVQALVALGYGSAESLRAVKKTSVQCQTVEDIFERSAAVSFLMVQDVDKAGKEIMDGNGKTNDNDRKLRGRH